MRRRPPGFSKVYVSAKVLIFCYSPELTITLQAGFGSKLVCVQIVLFISCGQAVLSAATHLAVRSGYVLRPVGHEEECGSDGKVCPQCYRIFPGKAYVRPWGLGLILFKTYIV